jgi:maltose/moltooligosaccharide transporter
MEKPKQGWAGLWNISFGFFGIQIGFALQNANMSRIFQTLSPNNPEVLNDLPALWVAAPLTGLLIQPIIGHLSDRTWFGRLGRRRPYFLAGAIMATLALLVMPLAPVLLFAAVMLWLLDASLNISMEPFRAFVGDMRRWCGRRFDLPEVSGLSRRRERSAAGSHTRYRPICLLVRGRCAVLRGTLDRRNHARI